MTQADASSTLPFRSRRLGGPFLSAVAQLHRGGLCARASGVGAGSGGGAGRGGPGAAASEAACARRRFEAAAAAAHVATVLTAFFLLAIILRRARIFWKVPTMRTIRSSRPSRSSEKLEPRLTLGCSTTKSSARPHTMMKRSATLRASAGGKIAVGGLAHDGAAWSRRRTTEVGPTLCKDPQQNLSKEDPQKDEVYKDSDSVLLVDEAQGQAAVGTVPEPIGTGRVAG